MKNILIIFILLGISSYGDVLDRVYDIAAGSKLLQSEEQKIPYDDELLERLDFSDERLRREAGDGVSLEERIRDIDDPAYSRWAYAVDRIVILSVSEGIRRETDNYVFRRGAEGSYHYLGNYFSGDYTTGLTIIEEGDTLYILVYYLDEGDKDLLSCEVYNKELELVGRVVRRDVEYTLHGEGGPLRPEEALEMLYKQERVFIGGDIHEGEDLDKQAFTLDYTNDGTLEDIYFEYYRSQSYNTQDELKIGFSNEETDAYFRRVLGRVTGMRIFEDEGRVYMAFLERKAFYGDRDYGNYIRVFLAEDGRIQETARINYSREKQFEIERM